MNRQEHLDWCKKRAIELLESGDSKQAVTSMISDLGKHKETRNHAGIQLGVMLMMSGHLSKSEDVRHFIEGFN